MPSKNCDFCYFCDFSKNYKKLEKSQFLLLHANLDISDMPENFLEINQNFALMSYCNTIGQLNNAFSILGFSLAEKKRVHVLISSSIG